MQFLEENEGQKFLNFGYDNAFLGMTLKAQAIKAKINKLDFMKNKKNVYIKRLSTECKGQLTEWRKYLQIISDKRLKNFYNSTIKT